jgi:hypothetical protein
LATPRYGSRAIGFPVCPAQLAQTVCEQSGAGNFTNKFGPPIAASELY